jgi:hypothetical protein
LDNTRAVLNIFLIDFDKKKKLRKTMATNEQKTRFSQQRRKPAFCERRVFSFERDAHIKRKKSPLKHEELL